MWARTRLHGPDRMRVSTSSGSAKARKVPTGPKKWLPWPQNIAKTEVIDRSIVLLFKQEKSKEKNRGKKEQQKEGVDQMPHLIAWTFEACNGGILQLWVVLRGAFGRRFLRR